MFEIFAPLGCKMLCFMGGEEQLAGGGGGGGGGNDARRADTINNLADLCHSEGSLSEAEHLYTSALRLREAALGAEHPAVAGSVNNLAVLLMDQSRVAEALPLLRRAASLAKAQLGAEHPHRATALANLAAGHAPPVEASEWCGQGYLAASGPPLSCPDASHPHSPAAACSVRHAGSSSTARTRRRGST